jgi:DNA phosphorothioation-dependent restriction protein DptH
LAERVKSLQVHQCLYKSFDVPGEVVRGLPFFELVARMEFES